MRTNHHTDDECQILGKNRNLLVENGIDATGILLALRLWLIKHKNPAVWEKINHMEAHLDRRIDTPVWKDREINVVNVIFHKSNYKFQICRTLDSQSTLLSIVYLNNMHVYR